MLESTAESISSIKILLIFPMFVFEEFNNLHDMW